MIRVLYIEDDRLQVDFVRDVLERKGISITAAGSVAEAGQVFNGGCFDIVLTDIRLPDGSGMDFVDRMRAEDETTPVVVITGNPSMNSSVQALRLGVSDYLFKPVDIEQLEMKIRSLCPVAASAVEGGADGSREALSGMVGGSRAVREVKARVLSVADSGVNVLINGETGTGKEVCARMIHNAGKRKDEPFVPVNCASLTYDLFTRELFGHVKGSFTGADESRQGYMAASGKGTLFLDEIGEIDLASQAKLLRAVELGEFNPIGETAPRALESRIITATNVDLNRAVEKGRFRSDLLYRLNVFRIDLPPLRDRMEDIPLLAEHFIGKHNRTHSLGVTGLSRSALNKMMSYHWPGNVRELENALLGAMIHRKSGEIAPNDLPLKGEVAPTAGDRRNEKEWLIKAIIDNKGDVDAVLRQTGLSRSAFYRRTKKYGIRPNDFFS